MSLGDMVTADLLDSTAKSDRRWRAREDLWHFGGRRGYTLNEMCHDLRSHVNGSWDPPWPQEKVEMAISILKRTLDSWYEMDPAPGSRVAGLNHQYDKIIHAMCRTTMQIAQWYLADREGNW